jgi:hypothetical protein
MATAIDEVAAFVASACSLTVGTNLFRHSMPDKPNACACVYEYPGLAPDFVLGQTAIDVEHPRLQIAFRGAPGDHATPRALAETAYRACAAASNTTLSGTKYFELKPLQTPHKLRQDANDRPVIGFSVQASKVLS